MRVKLTDPDGDDLHITESEDFLCYLSVNNDSMFGVTPLHAYKIIEVLQKLLDENCTK